MKRRACARSSRWYSLSDLWGGASCSAGSPVTIADGGLEDSPANPPGCPASLPPPQSSCASSGLACSYGCNRSATCNGGSWTVIESNIACPSDAGNVTDALVWHDATWTGCGCPTAGLPIGSGVCGRDAVTYPSACFAQCGGTTVADGCLCGRAPGSVCGCTHQLDLVCGSDGQTWTNACLASWQNVSVKSIGAARKLAGIKPYEDHQNSLTSRCGASRIARRQTRRAVIGDGAAAIRGDRARAVLPAYARRGSWVGDALKSARAEPTGDRITRISVFGGQAPGTIASFGASCSIRGASIESCIAADI
jgi:hypothetical protein